MKQPKQKQSNNMIVMVPGVYAQSYSAYIMFDPKTSEILSRGFTPKDVRQFFHFYGYSHAVKNPKTALFGLIPSNNEVSRIKAMDALWDEWVEENGNAPKTLTAAEINGYFEMGDPIGLKFALQKRMASGVMDSNISDVAREMSIYLKTMYPKKRPRKIQSVN